MRRARRDEAARRNARNAGGDGGSDDDEMPEDVRARRRGKVIAKNEAKRAKERQWEQARQAKQQAKDEESFMRRTYKKILNAANVIPGVSARREKEEDQARQNAVSAARWAGVASVWQGKQEEEKKNVGGTKPLAMLLKQVGTLLPTFTPTVKPTLTPTITYTPNATSTKTPLPTPTTDNIAIALSYLQYSPQGLDLYRELNRKANNVIIEYSPTTNGAMIPVPITKEYLFGLIKIHTYDVKILVNPQQTPTFIAGTIAHESYHFLTPGNTGLEEYNAYRIGDEVRNDIIQAGYGTSADLFAPLSDYTVNTSNPNLGQLILDLDTWFIQHRIPNYASGGSYGMAPLPTMPTSTVTPSSTPTFTQTPTATQTLTPTPTATQIPTPTETPMPNQIRSGQ